MKHADDTSLSAETRRTTKRVSVPRPHDVQVVSVAEPAPREGEALVTITSMGICATDLALIAGQNAVSRYPTFLGHEAVGVVRSAPPNSGFEAGDHVAVFPTLSCGSCAACGAGRENQCVEMTVMGLSDGNGLFSETVAVPVSQLLEISAEVAEQHGALVEPTAVAVHIVRRGGVQRTDRLLVIGAGVVGIVSALVARSMGVSEIAFVDRLETRRSVLEELGFHQLQVADLDGGAPPGGLSPAFHPDVVIDTVTSTVSARSSLRVLRSGGRYLPVASARPSQMLAVAYDEMYGRELAIVACRNYTRRDFETAAELLASGSVDPGPIVTRSWRLEEFPAAIAALRRNPDSLKYMMRP